jgi:general secretion pathway protein D
MTERVGLRSACGYSFLMLVFVFLVSGCAAGMAGKAPSGPAPEASNPFVKLMVGEEPPEAAAELKTAEELPVETKERAPAKPAQNLKYIAPPDPLLKARETAKPARARVDTSPKVHIELAFDNADLYEVLDATLYELFKVNYIVDPSTRAKVTFHLAGEYTRSEFIDLLNNVLQLSGLSIVKGPGETFKVLQRPLSPGAGDAPVVVQGQSDLAGDITRLIKLRYVAAPTAANNIRPFLSKGAMVVPDTVNNSLIISDTPDNVDKALGILNIMDGEYFSDLSWQIFPAREVDAADMAADLLKVMKAGGLFNRPGVDQGSFEIFPIKTMNALLVVSRWPSILKLVEEWVSAMDHKDESGTNVYVYFVENGTAVDISDILNQLFGGKSKSRTKAKDKTKKVTIVEPEKKAEPRPEVPSGELTGEVEIIPDEINNAIVFKATGRDYKIIKDVLRQLDVVPRQVLITAVMAEVTLTGVLEYGVEWFLRGHAGQYNIPAILDTKDTSTSIDQGLGAATGFRLAVFDGADLLRALITAVDTASAVNLIASPHLLVVDNKEASIEVGDEIPTVTGQITDATTGGTVTNTVQYRTTGVILRVTPHINSTGLVKMDVAQEFSVPTNIQGASGNVAIRSRKAETSLVVESGQTIFIGGIMRSTDDRSNAGFPVLKDVPLLGYLFGSRSSTIEKTELILLITPYVIQNRSAADDITREFSNKVKKMTDRLNGKNN